MITLYQFPISHFCEKVRWALDFKGLEYRTRNLLPGEHSKVVKALAEKSELPVLQHNKEVIQGSSQIITYLDQAFPDKLLTPIDPAKKQQALDWEDYADQNIGPHTRLYFYHHLLDATQLIMPLLVHGQPWHKQWMFRAIFPEVRKKMRVLMRINEKSACTSLEHIKAAIDRLAAQYVNKPFLTGGQFTRADIAAAALLAPFRSPSKYGLAWPKIFPAELQQSVELFKDQLAWVDSLYLDFR